MHPLAKMDPDLVGYDPSCRGRGRQLFYLGSLLIKISPDPFYRGTYARQIFRLLPCPSSLSCSCSCSCACGARRWRKTCPRLPVRERGRCGVLVGMGKLLPSELPSALCRDPSRG